MRAIYIYNPHNAREVESLKDINSVFPDIVEVVEAVDFQLVRDVYPVRATPAIIFIRDDFQGEFILGESMVPSKLGISAIIAKQLQEEEAELHGKEEDRLQAVVDRRVAEEAIRLNGAIEGVQQAQATQDDLLMDIVLSTSEGGA